MALLFRFSSFLCISVLLGVGLTPTLTWAQPQPTKHVVAPQIADGAQDVHAADLDGDGDQDVLSASRFDDKIAWYENTSSGFSDERVVTTNAAVATSVTAADLDGDSDLDILSASEGDNKIAWYENTSSGFSDQKVITTNAEGAESVYAANLDGDSDVDVLSASAGDNKIAWYENTSSGFSSQRVITTSAGSAQSVYAADLDGDSDMDVLSASYSDNKVAWYENTSSGFSDQKVITTNANGAESVYAANLDGDSDVDVLSASYEDDKVAWYENTSSGFSSQNIITTSADGAYSVHAANLDGDSDVDVLSASVRDNKVAAYDNQLNEGGGFSNTNITTSANGATSVYAADVDGDSDLDVLSASESDDKIAVYDNQLSEGGGFSSGIVITPHNRVKYIGSVTTGDIDGDGLEDILSGSGDGKVAWYENTGSGFTTQRVITINSVSAYDVHAAHVNNDSDLDVLSADGDRIAWHENTGGGSFSDPNVITTDVNAARSVSAARLTDGSEQDIFYGELDGVAWHENTGSGSFSDKRIVTTNVSGVATVHAADLNDDSRIDVLSITPSDDKVAWYENTGGSFSSQKVISAGNADIGSSVYTADLDGDSDLDVLAAGIDGVYWYENTTSGFSSQKTVTTNAYRARSVYASDLDGDADPDVVSASRDGVQWNETSSSFGSVSFSSVNTIDSKRGSVVVTADLNENGSPDVLSGLRGSPDAVAWYENTSSVLPVEMAGIEATLNSGGAVLQWRTGSEQNNAGFEVQRRVDASDTDAVGLSRGGRWKEIGFVEGAGTTSEPQNYRFKDSFEGLPFAADTVAYRLRQIDTDGSFNYSKVVRIERSVSNLQIQSTAPNPASQTVTVRYAVPNREESPETILHVYDALGRKVRSVQVGVRPGRQQLQLDVSSLASGTYFLRLSANGKTVTQKLTVVK